MGSLSNLYISQSYQSLTHLGTDNALVPGTMTKLEDGIGQSLNISFDGTNISSSGNIFAANITASVVNTGSLVTTSSFNSYTQSTNVRLTNIESTTASLNSSVTQLNASSASQQISINNLNTTTASLLIETQNLELFSASALVSISNLNQSSASQQVSINALNQFTASQSTASIVTSIDNLNTFTASANIRLNNLEITSASVNISISNLNSTTASQATSISNLNTSASLALITASLSGQTLTFTKGNNSTFGIILPDVSGSDITALNQFTASQLLINTGYNTFTSSTNTSISSLNQFTASQSTASLVTSITELNTFSASAKISISALNSATSSYVTETESGSFLITASFDNGNRNLTFTKGDNTTFNVNIPDVSGSAGNFVTTSSFNAYTSSNDQRVTSLESNSASVNISISNLNTFSQSAQISINSLNGATSSYANSASVALVDANQQSQINSLIAATGSYLTASADITALNQFTASQLNINTGYNTFTSSANQRLSSLETTSASVNISISSLNTFTASQSTASIVTSINNLNQFSASALISISNINSTTASLNSSVSQLNASSASQQISIDNLNAATSSYITESETASFARTNVDNNFTANQTFTNITATSASITYLTTLYETASVIYSSGSNQLGDELTDVQTLSGSVRVQGSLTVNGTPVLTSSVDISGLVTTASFNQYTQSNDNKVNSLINATASYANSASVALVDANQQQQINSLIAVTGSFLTSSADITLLNQFTASQLLINTGYNQFTQSIQAEVDNLQSVTGSYLSTSSFNQYTASQNALNATFATTGSNAFFGTNTFSGAVSFTGSAPSILSQSFSGSLITNLTDTYTNVAAVEQIVTLTSASYAALISGSLTNPNTLYIVSGSTAAGYVTVSTFNTYTSSNDQRVSSLEVNSASVNTSISNINTTTASILIETQNLELFSASALISISNLNQFTASQSTASIVNSINELNTFSASALTSINALNGATSSYVTETESGSFLITASFNNGTRDLTFTKGDNTTFAVNIPDVSGSAGDFVTTASFNSYTSSNDQKVNSLISATGSYATTGSNNFVGNQIITGSITTTQDITISGVRFGFGNPAGTSSIAIGNSNTLQNNTDDNNIAIGNSALQQNTTGERNIGIGTEALKSITGNSNYNVAIGGYALSAATSSTNTFALGYAAMENAIDSNENIAIGVAALYRKKANSNANTAIGSNALREHFDGDSNNGQNLAFGLDTMRYVTSGSGNTAIGSAALRDASRANENVFIGWIAGYNASGSVDQNVVIGGRAGQKLANSSNTIIGHNAASNLINGGANTFIGQGAGASIVTGSQNTLIGSQNAGVDNWNNVIAISDGGGAIKTKFQSNIWEFTGSVDIQNTLTASLQQGFTYVGDANGRTTLVATSSFGGGGTINTGSFATTGSNTFRGDQTISGSENHLLFTRTGANDIFRIGTSDNGNTYDFTVTGSTNQQLWLIDNQGGTYINTFIAPIIATNNVRLEGGFTASLQDGYAWVGNSAGKNTQVPTSSFGGGGALPSGLLSSSVTNFVDYSASVDTRINNIVAGTGFATTGSNTFTGNQLISKNAAEFQMTDPTNPSYGTASFGISGPSGGLLFKQSGSTIMEGQFGTQNMTFYGNAQIQNGGLVSITGQASDGRIVMLGNSGSLVLSNSSVTTTYAGLSHLSSSQPNSNTNLIFKTNNNTADTIISGSINLFVNPAAPTTGFKRYVGGSGNIMLNASNVPQISGSMAFSPTMNNNYFGGNSNTLSMRGPVSSSAYTISANSLLGTVNFGSSAANHAQGMVSGLTMTGNNVNGTFNIVANKANLTQALTLQNNNIGGQLTLTPASSSIVWLGNTSQGVVSLTNEVSGSGARIVSQSNAVYSNQNIIGGQLTINASGAETSNDPTAQFYLRHFERNLTAGTGNNVRLNGETSSSNGLTSTAIIGNNLTVTGSNSSAVGGATPINYGSAFFGRYNAQDGNKALSAQTVFAVGTGDTTTRKTGFLIDSGSNTFIEGTLNVSGSTTLSGSLYIQSGSTLPSATGSAILTWNPTTGQVSQSPIATLISSSFSVGAFNSTITQSGSANVSQSMTYNNTDISNGVSIVSNSQITLANNGTYNIQFSAQVLAGTGADTIWIWLKKNGTNVSNTATKLVLANNEADVAAWNFVVPAVATDYFELVWQNLNGHATLLTEAASGNYPAIPSIIVTVTQVE
jgi:uncharacterized coiled-coil protein SlyX